MGRKRNQGKARRAAKAKAREEAAESVNNNQVIADRQEQALSEQMRQVQVGDKKCLHGYNPSNDSTDDFCFQFVKAFKESFDEVIRDGIPPLEVLLLAKHATMDQFVDVWNDSTKMEMATSLLLHGGTNAFLDTEDRIARDFATFARFLEQYNALKLKQSQGNINWSKIFDIYYADEHTLVKFFWKRIPCSCLDKKYGEVKHITKMGYCWNPQCSIPGRRVERSQTKYCSRCRNITYCSRECQEAAWLNHKRDCDNNAAMIANFEAKRESK